VGLCEHAGIALRNNKRIGPQHSCFPRSYDSAEYLQSVFAGLENVPLGVRRKQKMMIRYYPLIANENSATPKKSLVAEYPDWKALSVFSM
jgi:hypothetical protein